LSVEQSPCPPVDGSDINIIVTNVCAFAKSFAAGSLLEQKQ
jgi:hypothetical protein